MKIKVCIFGTYRATNTRHQALLSRLKISGIETVECHEKLWMSEEDRVQAASGGWKKPAFISRVFCTYIRLIYKYFIVQNDYDILLIGYPGPFDVFLGRLLSWFHHKPMIWDIYMSIYLIAKERQLDLKSKFSVSAIRWIEKQACRLPDMLFIDTKAYTNWFIENYNIPSNHIRLAPLGADDRIFHPIEGVIKPNDCFLIIFYGTFHPNSGVTFIIEAAHMLINTAKINFELIGRGPDLDKCQRMAREYRLDNLVFTDWKDKDSLVKKIAEADICLGSFGTTPQSFITVHNKIYESLAMAKPVITGDSPAVREIMEHEKHIYLVDRANPEAIASAILRLVSENDLRIFISRNGYELFKQNFTNSILGTQIRRHLEELL